MGDHGFAKDMEIISGLSVADSGFARFHFCPDDGVGFKLAEQSGSGFGVEVSGERGSHEDYQAGATDSEGMGVGRYEADGCQLLVVILDAEDGCKLSGPQTRVMIG